MTSRRGVIEVAGPVLIPPPVAPWASVDVPAGGTTTSRETHRELEQDQGTCP